MRPARLILRTLAMRSALIKPLMTVQPLTMRCAAARFSTEAAPVATEEGDEEEYEDDEEGEEGEGEEEDNFDEALLEYFTALDAEEAAKAQPLRPLPIKVSGISGDLAAALYRQGIKEENFGAIVDDLFGLNEIVQGSPEIISRFFVHNNYSPEECRVVVELLTSDKYQSFDSITNTDYREIIFGSAENVESWQDARAEVKALNLETATEGLLKKLADMARLDLLPYIANTTADIYTAETKTVSVNVTSALPLTDDQKNRITASLPKYANNAQLDVTFEVDSSVLGGLLITLGNQSIDLTASSQLMETAQEYN